MTLPAPIDVTSVLRPGVYVLWHEARCVYIGRSTLPIVQLLAHRASARGLPKYLRGTLRGIAYDRVDIYPASGAAATTLEFALCARLRPLHSHHTSAPSAPLYRLKPSHPPSPP